MTTLLSVDGIGIAFGGVQVLHDISFHVPEGGRVALIGPNGAGKTTLFNVLCGVHAPDTGRLTLRGQDFTAMPASRRIRLGMSRSFQNIRLMPHLSVVENVMLGQHSRAGGSALFSLVARGLPSRWRREAEDRLASFGLGAYPGESVSDLPYGVRKKIEVVRALMSNPVLMLLDEPAAGLNPRETADLNDFLLRIADNGVAMLVVEHDMSLVRGLCTHAVVLDFGRKIYDGPTETVQNDPAVLEAYLGRRHAQAVTEAIA
jgi:branched-chain amino acid transport system ATP-binding protein